MSLWALDQSEGALANKRVVRLVIAVDQSEGGVANKRVVRLSRAVDQPDANYLIRRW